MSISKLADRFWERMEEMYGAEWTNKHGMEPKELWIEMLESVDPQAIKHAIKEFLHSNPRAPTMPEVAAYLKAFNRVIQNEEQFKSLPKKEMTEQERLAARETIKKAAPKQLKGNRRSVLLHDESYFDFMAKLAEAMNQGISKNEFYTERLKNNGWTLEDESVFMGRVASLGLAHKFKPMVDVLEE